MAEDALGIPKRKYKGTIPTAQNAEWDLNIQKHDADRAGCFMPSTRITMSDGSTKYIRDINPGDNVLSYNLDSQKLEPKKVLSVWENGNTDLWHKIYINQRNGLTSTPEHEVFVYSKKDKKVVKKKARNIDINSDYLLKEDKSLSETQKQFILGSLMGDGSIIRNSENAVVFNWGQANHRNLVKRISKIFNTKLEVRSEEGNKSEFYYFRLRHKWLIEIAEKFYPNDNKRINEDILSLLQPQAIAQWYMDDGQWAPAKSQFKTLKRNTKRRKDAGRDPYSGQISLYTNGFSKEENEIISKWFNKKYKISFSVRSRYLEEQGKEYFYLVSNSIKSNRNFFSLISEYIQPEFSYKTVKEVNSSFKLETFNSGSELYKIRILKKEEYKTKQGPNKNQKCSYKKYDLEVEDNHNYFASGSLVSNSHYDIRLSPKGSGVAYSWAAKKLPKPGQKTTAAQTDLHTRRYMGFSGEIKEGYGKGTVKSLTQEPVEVLKANPDKVEFNRYKGSESKRYILLRKPGTDEFLFYNYTPTQHTKVFQDVPTTKKSYKTVKLEDLDPAYREDKEVWAPKLDGAHNLIVLRGGKTPDIFSYRKSRKGPQRIDHTYRTQAYKERVPEEFKKTILRGELYLPGQPGEQTARLLNSNVWKSRKIQQKESRPLSVAAFDVVKWKGRNVEDLPYKDKIPMLEEINKKIGMIDVPPMAKSRQEKAELKNSILEQRHPLTYEGIVVYDLDSPTPRKSKKRLDWDAEIVGTFPAEPGSKYHNNGIGGFVVQPENSNVKLKVGSGLDDQMRRDAYQNPEKYIGQWAEFKSQRKHSSGLHQAPIFKRIRMEKFAKTLTNQEIDQIINKVKRKNLTKNTLEGAAVTGASLAGLSAIGDGLLGVRGKPLLKSVGAWGAAGALVGGARSAYVTNKKNERLDAFGNYLKKQAAFKTKNLEFIPGAVAGAASYDNLKQSSLWEKLASYVNNIHTK